MGCRIPSPRVSVDLSQFRLNAVALTAQPDGGALRKRVLRRVFLRLASQPRSYTSQLTDWRRQLTYGTLLVTSALKASLPIRFALSKFFTVT